MSTSSRRSPATFVGSAADAEPVFGGPLHELCAIGLVRPALEALASGTRIATPPTIDLGYLLKILDEEVGRQFGHPSRPIVELVLNAVDAARGLDRPVEVVTGPGRVEVTDRGEGMGLHAILSRLLVPFATDKRPGADIGRFGVGFFSVLSFGLSDPGSFALRVETSDGRESWMLDVTAGGARVEMLHATLRRAARGEGEVDARGTRVTVLSALLDAEGVRSYLRDALHFLSPKRAIVRVDGAPLNDGSLISGGRLFEDVAVPGVPPITARFQLGGRGLAAGISAGTYHMGVKVEACLAISELTLIDFPGAVELTEGRDALKPGPTFHAVAAAFHRRLVRLAEAAAAGARARDEIAGLAAQVSALLLGSAGWNELAPEIARRLLGDGRYLVSPERAEAVLGFLGPEIGPRLFVPESFWAEREWSAFLPGERELLERELEIDPPEPLASVALRRVDLAGLVALAIRSTSPEATQVSLVRGRTRGPGALPCLGTRQAVLVREDAPAVRAPRRWTDLYALRAAFDRATGAREADVERDLIIHDPLGAILHT